jgi:signal peptidase I
MRKKKKDIFERKTAWQKIWYFIWHDDSALSWIVNLILAFIIIKYLLYPGLGLLFGTSLPIVAVVSNSMEHPGGFEEWWQSHAICERNDCTQQQWYQERDINHNEFQEFPFSNGFNKGDIMILIGKDPAEINKGEIIVFQSGKPYPIIHRVIDTRTEGNETIFETKGDHNPKQLSDPQLDEKEVREDQLIGKAVMRVPLLGYIKIWFVEILKFIGLGSLVSG